MAHMMEMELVSVILDMLEMEFFVGQILILMASLTIHWTVLTLLVSKTIVQSFQTLDKKMLMVMVRVTAVMMIRIMMEFLMHLITVRSTQMLVKKMEMLMD